MKIHKTVLSLLLSLPFLAPTFALASCKDKRRENAYFFSGVETPTDEELPIEPPTDAPIVEEPTPPVEETPPTPVVEYAQYVRTTTNGVNIRLGAGTSYAVYAQAEKGETYAVVGRTGNWYETYYRGKTVYISASYVAVFSIEKADSEVEKVLGEGYRLLGVPYVYGAVRLHDGKGNLLSGFSAQKFDCSSLVQYVFYQGAGKLLDVTTRTQVKQGTFVPSSELQRGDCIFFTNESRQHLSGIDRVGHVAVYLGDNYILHTSSDYARIEKMTAARWNFYIETRRFI